MNFPFRPRGVRRDATMDWAPEAPPLHVVESGFSYSMCRFTLDCRCGTHFDTPYIDEALEWRELHEVMAPLADRLVG